MVQQLPASGDRDMTYTGVIMRHAQENPYEAAGWINDIVDEAQRGAAAGQVASQVVRATIPRQQCAGVDTLQQGQMRDMAIVSMSGQFVDMTPAEQSLIDSIQDDQTRQPGTAQQHSHVDEQ